GGGGGGRGGRGGRGWGGREGGRSRSRSSWAASRWRRCTSGRWAAEERCRSWRGHTTRTEGRTMSAESIKAVHEIRLTELGQAGEGRKVLEANLDLIRGVKVRLTASVGRCELTVKELVELRENAVLTLDGGTRETVDVLLDGKVVARGTLVAAGDSFGVQVTEVLAR